MMNSADAGYKSRYSAPIRRMLLRTMLKRSMIYLSIALLEVALLTPVYMLAYKGARNSEQDYIKNGIVSNLRAFSSNMEALNRYMYALMSEDSITYLAYISDWNGLHASKIRELYREIQRSAILHSVYLDDLIVQFNNSNYMIAGGNIYQRANYYGFALEYENYDQSMYEELMYDACQPILPVQRVITESIRDKRALTFNYFNSATINGKYAISAVICEDTLINALVPEEIQEYGYFRLAAADGNELFGVGEPTEEMDIFDDITDSRGTFRVSYGVDKHVYVENIHGMLSLIVVYCVLALGIAVLYSILLAARSLRMIQSVMALLDDAHPDDGNNDIGARDINDFVNEMLKKQLIRADEMEESFKKIQKRYKDEMVFSLLRGSYHAEKSDLQLLEGNSVFQDQYLVLEMCMGDDEATTIHMKEEAMKMAAEMFEKYMPTLYIASTQPFVAIMPLQSNSHALIQAVCTEITKRIAPVRMAVSSAHEGIENLSNAYSEARMVRRNKHLFMMEEVCIMRFDVLSEQLGDNEMLALDVGNAFARLITEGRREELEARLQKMNRHFERLALENSQRFSGSYYNVINMFESFYRSLHVPVKIREYDPETPIAEIEKYLREIALDIFERMAVQREKIEPHDGIVDYINEHFTDSGMSLGLLSNKFDLSEAYISRIVKRCTGMNYTEYLEKLRMKKAEELLFHTQLSVGEISALLGYDNQNTFFKAFKRFYQLSPGAYRESQSLHCTPQ